MVKIVCEGRTDKNKIQELLEHLGIEYSENDFIVMGNKSNCFKKDDARYKTLLTLIKAEKIEKVLFIIDADDIENDNKFGGYENTEKKLRQLINTLDIHKISTIYIMCDPISKEGYLESLLLSTVDSNPKQCYDELLDCLKMPNKNNNKYVMEQLHRLSNPDNPYDFEHENFKDLKEKLSNHFHH